MPRFPSRPRYTLALAAVALAVALAGTGRPRPVTAGPPRGPTVTVLASGLAGGSGSTVGPDGALYVTEWEAGRVRRIDPKTGRVTTFADGLPPGPPWIPYSGALDVAFLCDTAYVLVTLVGPDAGGEDVVGIYRVDGPNTFTVVADIGAWSAAHLPETEIEFPTGAQYALEPYRGGFLVTDSHHNRVLRVELDGDIREVATFGNTAVAGMAVRGNTVYAAEAGPIPHLPAGGRVVAFGPKKPPAVIAGGVSLLVDVEFGPGNTLYAVANGVWGGGIPGDPALPDTGSLLRVNADGTLTTLVPGLDRPCSLEFIGKTAYVVTLGGDVLKIDGLPK